MIKKFLVVTSLFFLMVPLIAEDIEKTEKELLYVGNIELNKSIFNYEIEKKTKDLKQLIENLTPDLIEYNIENDSKGEFKKETNPKVTKKLNLETFVIKPNNGLNTAEPLRKKAQSDARAVKISEYYGDPYEPNDTIYEATNLTYYNQVWLSSIAGTAYLDYTPDIYEIYVEQDYENLIVSMPFYGDWADNIYFRILDQFGFTVASSYPKDLYSEGLNEILDTGTYYIEVYGNYGNEIEYDLWWGTFSPYPDTYRDDYYEVNNSLQTAYDLSDFENVWLSDYLGHGIQADEDWYAIYAYKGDRIKIDLLFLHADGDIDLRLYDKYGKLLQSSRSFNDNEHISYLLGACSDYSGYYYIKVFYSDVGNYYDLRWNTVYVGYPNCNQKSSKGCFIGALNESGHNWINDIGKTFKALWRKIIK